jgi:hypothetical protein
MSTLTSPIHQQLSALLESAAAEHATAAMVFNRIKTGENARRLSAAMDLLESVIALCEANGIEVK